MLACNIRIPVPTFITRHKQKNCTRKTPGKLVRAVNSTEVAWGSVHYGFYHVPQGHSYRKYKLDDVFSLRHPARCNSKYATCLPPLLQFLIFKRLVVTMLFI